MKPGHEQLADWIERRGFSQREAASFLGWHETFLSKILTTDRSPGLANAVKIERETGIPAEAWLSIRLDKSGNGRRGKGRKHAKSLG
jgi:plasmid maintenance system antidote protein VapI